MNKKALAQHFTPSNIAEKMCALSQRTGTVLEPSSGDGAIFKPLFKAGREVFAYEKDAAVAHRGAIVKDFFDIPVAGYGVGTVVMNPPYLKHSRIPEDTRSLPEFKELEPMLGSANLYAYFIAKALKHLNPKGELIAIVPVDFLNSSSGIELRKWMDMVGVITKVVDLTDRRVFPDALPDTIVFRFSLDCTEKPVLKLVGGNYVHTSVFGERLGDLATVHVGCVPISKAEAMRSVNRGCFHFNEYVHSQTIETNRCVAYDTSTGWIRKPNGIRARLFVNCKTRKERPFYVLEREHPFDGSVLGIIPREGVDIYELCDRLNAVDWRLQFLKQGGRFSFSQRCLTEALV